MGELLTSGHADQAGLVSGPNAIPCRLRVQPARDQRG
jgi:hypothetical protein